MLTINSYEEFASFEGKELGVSEWIHITQQRINQFADATDDHQWIHVDADKCKTESPFGKNLAILQLRVTQWLWPLVPSSAAPSPPLPRV